MKLTRITFTFLLLSSLPFSLQSMKAESGDDNPTGPTGIFNGNITTGGSYDPYTRNAMRRVTDIVVEGAVGTQPLAFTRFSNSRYSSNYRPFAYAGCWQHSYTWFTDDEPLYFSDPNTLPTAYTVHFPDGRSIRFTSAAGTPAGDAGETNFRGPIGVSERLTPLTSAGGSMYLILTDGSKVKFQATVHSSGGQWIRTYQALQMIDRFGLVTTLSYNSDGTLAKVTEPAGRSLEFVYTDFFNGQTYDHVLSIVHASDGRQVNYDYEGQQFSTGGPSYSCLTTVSYYQDSTFPRAVYSYKAPNVPDFTGHYYGVPLLASCDDPMYEGAMKQIAYNYLNYSSDSSAEYGELVCERHTLTADTVSTISGGGNGIDITRTETRGDGRTRTFTYRTWPYLGHLLFGYTRFNPLAPGVLLGYDFSNYLSHYQDSNGHSTDMIREPITGRITQLTHPADKNGVRSTVYYSYKDPLNPYFLDYRTDELSHTTYYRRTDAAHPNRLTRIDYPDGAWEGFVYDDIHGFNQLSRHRVTAGGTEIWNYNGRGLKQSYTNTEQKTTTYGYDSWDRVASATDPRNNEVDFAYNNRGQLTVTTFPPDPTTGVRYTKVNLFDGYGSLYSVTDELGSLTTYLRDDYGRVTTLIDRNGKWTMYSYTPWGKTSSYIITSDFAYSTTWAGGKVEYQYADDEFRLLQDTVAPGTADEASSYLTYDYVGNVKTSKNRRGKVTSFDYDDRDRLITRTEPLGHVTKWDYDQASNKLKETRPDNKFQTWDTFDAMNRVKHTTGFLGDPTSFVYDYAGNMTRMTDSKNATYGFSYDAMNRKIGATYPKDANGVVGTEVWHYDDAGNLDYYVNPAGQKDQFTYDNRNRKIGSQWIGVAGSAIQTAYDAASNITSITTADGTLVGFGYDRMGRQIWEEQTLDGLPTRHVTTNLDDDGLRNSLTLDGVYDQAYSYTGRRELYQLRSNGQLWFTYTRDLNGNVTKRQDNKQGLDSTLLSYDDLDRITLCTQTGANDVAFAWSHYDYDLNDRVQDTWREEQANKGERFEYDDANQLKSAVYNADNVTTPNPINYDRSVSYTCDALNRTAMNDNGVITNYTPNGLNQYTAITGQQPTYDSNFNLKKLSNWSLVYNPDNRLVSATGGGHQIKFYYDGLNRCLKRTVDGIATVFTYDGWKPIAEWDGTGNLLAWNMYGPGPDEILVRWSTSANYLHYHSDPLGNVKFLLDRNNVGIEKYTYDAFGAPKITDWNGNTRTDSAYGNRFMFTGREYLSTIGIYDLRKRVYSPLIGRFLQADPIGFEGDATNLFRYCGNNPVSIGDPTGEYAVRLPGGGWTYVANPGYGNTAGGFIVNPNPNWTEQCATGGQYLSGTIIYGQVYDVPSTTTWTKGAALGPSTTPGTLVATGWIDGKYPGLSTDDYKHIYGQNSTVNHTAVFEGIDPDTGEYMFYDQATGKPLGSHAGSPDGWYVVNGPSAHDRSPTSSNFASVVGRDPNTGKFIFQGIAVPRPSLFSTLGDFLANLFANNGVASGPGFEVVPLGGGEQWRMPPALTPNIQL